MWAFESVFYQIYPLGFCGAPFENDDRVEHRILKVLDWIPHLKRMNINAVYFGPVFESDTHGYNTRDYRKIDVRLGTKEDFQKVCAALHKEGIKVVLDGVFNHVGRGFWAFEAVLKNREASSYVNWFSRIDFSGNSAYNDGLWYEGWEGCYDLVKLNLYNEDVVNHIFGAVKGWIQDYDIDGIRLDVAYCLNNEFLNRLRGFTDSMKQDFFLVGEVLHGEYGRMLENMGIHSLTNYQCYKGIYSAFNSYNMFEIVHSLLRLFGPEDWTVCRGAHLLSFCDNHDVSRIASILNNPHHLKGVYGMVFGMPGIPCVYYGSEWGARGDKAEGDQALRASLEEPIYNDLAEFISKLAAIKKASPALNYGSFRSVVLTNRACIFERCVYGERMLIAINADESSFTTGALNGQGKARELISNQDIPLNELSLEPYEVKFLRQN